MVGQRLVQSLTGQWRPFNGSRCLPDSEHFPRPACANWRGVGIGNWATAR